MEDGYNIFVVEPLANVPFLDLSLVDLFPFNGIRFSPLNRDNSGMIDLRGEEVVISFHHLHHLLQLLILIQANDGLLLSNPVLPARPLLVGQSRRHSRSVFFLP